MSRTSAKIALPLLATLLLLIALLATGVSHWLTSRALTRTVVALQTLRDKTGQLTIRNAEHLHVIALPMTEGLQWNWRLHIPPGNKYRMRWAVGHSIPQEGFAKEISVDDFDDILFSETPPSPLLLSAHLQEDDNVEDVQKNPLQLIWRHLHSETSIPIDFGGDIDWLVSRLRYGATLAGHTGTESYAPGQRIVLLRVRRFQDAMAGAYSIATDPCDGFMVWLEPM